MKRKTGLIYLAALGVIALTVMLLLDTLWAMGTAAQYSYYTVSCVMTELMFTLLTASTYISIARSGHRERLFVRLFLWMLAIVTVGMLGDVFAWGIGLEGYAWAALAQSPGAFFRDAMGFPLIVIYSIYLLSYINEDPRELKRFAWLVGGLCADGLLLVLIDQITSRSVTQSWHLWDHPWLFFFFLAVPMVVNMGIIFYFRRMLTNRKAVAFLFTNCWCWPPWCWISSLERSPWPMRWRPLLCCGCMSVCSWSMKSSRKRPCSNSASPSCSARSGPIFSIMCSPESELYAG